MKDLTIALENRPGALAKMGAALGRAGVSIEGGGAWVVASEGVAHFFFEDGTAARRPAQAGTDGMNEVCTMPLLVLRAYLMLILLRFLFGAR